jgi:hypothetical protein
VCLSACSDAASHNQTMFFRRVSLRQTLDSYLKPAPGSENMSEEHEIVRGYNEYTKKNREIFIYAPARNIVKGFQGVISWLNVHNGLLTAIATAAIAYLTVSISTDSKRQAETAVDLLSENQSQQKIMQGQLDEMQKQREFTIDQLRASFKRQDIRYQPIDKIGNPTTNNEDFSGWSFNPTWMNVGLTSAKNFASWSHGVVESPSIKKDGQIFWQCPNVPPIKFTGLSDSIVEKGGQITEIAINIPKDIAERTFGSNPETTLYLFGRIQYSDVFSSTLHYFEWCVVAVPSNLKTGGFSFHRMYEREG